MAILETFNKADETGRYSAKNAAKVLAAFEARGIPRDKITPYVNVPTFPDWLKLDRCVTRGRSPSVFISYARTTTIRTSRIEQPLVFFIFPRHTKSTPSRLPRC